MQSKKNAMSYNFGLNYVLFLDYIVIVLTPGTASYYYLSILPSKDHPQMTSRIAEPVAVIKVPQIVLRGIFGICF